MPVLYCRKSISSVWERAFILISEDNSGSTHCSGCMVDGNVVMTACFLITGIWSSSEGDGCSAEGVGSPVITLCG